MNPPIIADDMKVSLERDPSYDAGERPTEATPEKEAYRMVMGTEAGGAEVAVDAVSDTAAVTQATQDYYPDQAAQVVANFLEKGADSPETIAKLVGGIGSDSMSIDYIRSDFVNHQPGSN